VVSFLFALAMAATPPEGPSETLVRLTVDPMQAPKPALRIQLLPELREMKPGNPIAAYLGVLLDQDNRGPNRVQNTRRGRARQFDVRREAGVRNCLIGLTVE